MKVLYPIVLASLLLAGCASLTATPYQVPAVTLPAQWQGAAAADNSPISGDNWWQQFGDAELNRLVALVLSRNNDLAAAAIKVRQAMLKADLAATDLAPTPSFSLSSSASQRLGGAAVNSQTHSASLSVSYEADLWGQLSHLSDAKAWEARATEQDRAASRLSLIGSTIKLYWKQAWLQQRLQLGAASVDYQQQALRLVLAKQQAGAAAQLDVLTVRQSLASQQASLYDYQQQLAETRNALAILLDGPPLGVVTTPGSLPQQDLPDVPAGLPVQLLARRPDLRAAELRLRETLANGDATRASYYPDFSLTGSLGSSSSRLAQVVSNPLATLGAGLTLPFLEWRQMRLNTQISAADYQLAVVNFRQTLYAALADVENALSARSHYQQQGQRLTLSAQLAGQAEQLYRLRYQAGAAPLKDWLDAQETRRQAEVSLLENRYNRLVNQVTLYQALGGDAQLR